MKRGILFTFLIIVNCYLVIGQEPVFSVSISPDTILMGNSFRVEYKIENAARPDFQPPTFEDFKIVGGPNQSSSMMMVNGEVTQSVTYSYYLEPAMEGQFYLPPAKAVLTDNTLFTEPLEVIVLPNPEGIIQQPETTSSFGWDSDFFRMPELPKRKSPATKPKKKRKTYKL